MGEQPEEPEARVSSNLIEDPRREIRAPYAEDPRSKIRTPYVQDQYAQDPADRAAFIPAEEAVYEPALSTNELSLFQQGGCERSYSDGQDEELFSYSTAPRSYRAYVGIVLAIVICALGYTAWRSAQTTAQNSHVEPQAPPTVSQPAAPAPPSTTAKSETPDGSAPSGEQASVSPQPARNEETKTSTDKSARTRSSESPVPAAAEVTKPSEPSVTGNGAEELAIAQRYLTGGNGLQRNGSEAAKWLWKSMAKHNADATLLLADLYLKGDGVSKNCDQARVLLDSAARSGMKQAGERLQQLQAFGCE